MNVTKLPVQREAEARKPEHFGTSQEGQVETVKVLVVDDELHGFTAAHLRQHAAEFFFELSDTNSPLAEVVWHFAMESRGFPPIQEEDPRQVSAFFNSPEFVNDVLLSSRFRESQIEGLDMLALFYQRASSVLLLREQIENAFPSPAYSLTFVPARPSTPKSLLDYQLVILDLVLSGSGAAVDELVKYLLTLSNDAYPQSLPAIVILSTSEELIDKRLRFSAESRISAAGMLLLQKSQVANQHFGAAGLSLSYNQLKGQRDIAQYMRVFMFEWSKSLERATMAAMGTLWNLDASAMQEIHLSAFRDSDPYDEHISELVMREYLWHVEGASEVSKAIESLDAAFQAEFRKDAVPASIGRRLVVPFVDSKPGRDVVSHFNWNGFALPSSIVDMEMQEAMSRLNRLLPFGAVLIPPSIDNGTDCLVHITQQCDLNSATRMSREGKSLPQQAIVFAVASALRVDDHIIPPQGNDLVAKGLNVDGKEFDLKLQSGRMVALPIPECIEHIQKSKLRVAGRLRHDIANQFLNATANHMTRPAALKTTRVEIRNAQIFLCWKNLPDSKPVQFLYGDQPRIVSVTRHNKLNFLQDDASMWLALWLTKRMLDDCKKEVDTADLCNALRTGLADKQAIVGVMELTVLSSKFSDLEKFWKGRSAPERIQLAFIHEPEV